MQAKHRGRTGARRVIVFRVMAPACRILIVDDDANIPASLSEALVAHGALVEAADDGVSALSLTLPSSR
jgi:PleD family two-component response regulator